MDYKEIEQLLERYWQGDTSLNEEQTLRQFFLNNQVPAHLERYRALFAYQQMAQTERTSEDFEAKLMARIETEAPVVQIRSVSWMTRLKPLWNAAAAVALLLMMGNAIEHSFHRNDCEMALPDTISQQISAPNMALSEEAKKAKQAQQLIDSLKRIERQALEADSTADLQELK